MQEATVQILEVRSATGELPASITLSVTSGASQAIFTAVSEQLDRRRQDPVEGADDVTELRDAASLVERFEGLARAEAHAVVTFSPPELRSCLFDLTAYTERMDADQFQPPELRERLAVLAQVMPVLWDANTAAADAAVPAGNLAD
jgi:hypothetical protein